MGYSPQGGKELDTTERLPFHFHFQFSDSVESWGSGGPCDYSIYGLHRPDLIFSHNIY